MILDSLFKGARSINAKSGQMAVYAKGWLLVKSNLINEFSRSLSQTSDLVER